MKQTQYPEEFFTALHSLDLGDIYSPDGRAHPLTAMTPVSVVEHPIESNANVDIAATSLPAGVNTGPSYMPSLPSLQSLNPSSWMPQHIGARLVVGVVAIGLVLIVAWRLSK